MRKFVEFVDAETGRNVAVPSRCVFGVSGRDGAVTKVTMRHIGDDGALRDYPQQNEKDKFQSTTSYDFIMDQLRT